MMDPDTLSSALRDAAAAQPEVEDRLDLVTGRGRRRRRRARTVLGGIMLLGVIAAGLVLTDGDDSPTLHTVDVTSSDTQHAGELGPNGGVIWDGREMQSTPDELFESQDDGSTVVFSEAPPDSAPGLLRFYLGAERAGEHLCVTLHPAGETGPVAELCDIPAYRSQQQIVRESFVGEGFLTLDGVPTRVAYGMTYLDAASVSLGDSSGVEVQTGLPFWMHRFFALPAPADTTDIRLLDSHGDELARVPIGDR